MNRHLLEYQGKTYRVESCETCPARIKDEKGKPLCELRRTRLRVRTEGAFPQSPANPCPVYREGRKKARPKPDHTDKTPLIEKPKIYCSWCGHRINPMTAIVIINDREPDRIYDRFECLEQYLRTSNK